MSTGFQAVQWNRDKIVYDAVLVGCVTIYLACFIGIGWFLDPPPDPRAAIDLRIRAFGSCAFLMLTVALAIGPLARLDPRFRKLLYNRRHLGVLTFGIAALHAWSMIEWYTAKGELANLAVELTAWADYGTFIGFPFKMLGIAALAMLFLLAATSHDFWLKFLSPRIWKWLHMSLYAAYGLVVMHVALGAMQAEANVAMPLMLGTSLAILSVLHFVAGWRERSRDRGAAPGADGWLAVGAPSSIPDKAARIVLVPGGERIAVFRDGTLIGALTNLCAHQNGPIGEGRIVDGCVTCPWHGWQYRLADGCAPPPFTEKLATYPIRIRDGIVEVHPRPLAPGTRSAIVVSGADDGFA